MKTICRVLEILALIGIATLNYFSNAKMGMMRWLVYQNYVIEQKNEKIIIAGLILIMIYAIYMLKYKKYRPAAIASLCVILMFFSKRLLNGYFYNGRYFTVMLLIVILIIDFAQHVKIINLNK